MSKSMRAKFKVKSVVKFENTEEVVFSAVTKPSYDSSGYDEDNTYAKFTPGADCVIRIANPELIGIYKPGDVFYVDFTPVVENSLKENVQLHGGETSESGT